MSCNKIDTVLGSFVLANLNVWLSLVRRIQEVLGSNLGLRSVTLTQVFVSFLASSRQIPGLTLKQKMTTSFNTIPYSSFAVILPFEAI